MDDGENVVSRLPSVVKQLMIALFDLYAAREPIP